MDVRLNMETMPGHYAPTHRDKAKGEKYRSRAHVLGASGKFIEFVSDAIDCVLNSAVQQFDYQQNKQRYDQYQPFDRILGQSK